MVKEMKNKEKEIPIELSAYSGGWCPICRSVGGLYRHSINWYKCEKCKRVVCPNCMTYDKEKDKFLCIDCNSNKTKIGTEIIGTKLSPKQVKSARFVVFLLIFLLILIISSVFFPNYLSFIGVYIFLFLVYIILPIILYFYLKRK